MENERQFFEQIMKKICVLVDEYRRKVALGEVEDVKLEGQSEVKNDGH